MVGADPVGQAHVKLDGKRLRGSKRGKEKVLLVAAVDAARQVMGQVRSDDSDEIGAARNLIATVINQLGPQSITALRDHIANYPYTEPLRILGIADFEQKFEPTRLCKPWISMGVVAIAGVLGIVDAYVRDFSDRRRSRWTP